MKIIKSTMFLAILFAGCLFGQQNVNAQQQKTDALNLKQLHTTDKPVQTHLLFTTTEAEGKVISMQITAGKELKEHVSSLPAIFVCVSGEAVYEDEKGYSVVLKNGDYVLIEKDVKHKVNAKKDSNFLLIR